VRDAETYARSPVRIPHSVHVPMDSLTDRSARVPADPSRIAVAYCT